MNNVTSWVRWYAAWLRFGAQAWWRILTGRGRAPAPQSLEDAYSRQAGLRNRRQDERPDRDVPR